MEAVPIDDGQPRRGAMRHRGTTGGGGNGRLGGDRSGSDGSRSSDFSIVALSWLGAGFAIAAIVLYAVGRGLQLPSEYGIEDILGWSSAGLIAAAVGNWCQPTHDSWHAAAFYVLGDTAFFMPFYGALLLATARSLGRALQKGPAPTARALALVLQPASWFLTLLLLTIDALENWGGAQRIGVSAWGYFVSLLVGVALFLVLWRSVLATPEQRRLHTCHNFTALLVAAAVIALVVWVQDDARACEALARPDRGEFGWAWAHRAKPVAIVLATLPWSFAAIAWWFGLDLALSDPAQAALAERRAAWRAGVMGVVGRTRYVIVILILFAGFTIVLDQSRDVMLALATPLHAHASGQGVAWAAAWRLFVLLLGAMSIGLLAYASWLWTRLVAMVQRPGLALPGGHPVSTEVGEFARGWARAMSLAPLAIVCILIAQTTGDAVAAARISGDKGLVATLIYLFVFAAVAIASGYAFLEARRSLSLPSASSYYDSEPDTYMLLRTGTTVARVKGSGDGVSEPSPGCLARLRPKVQTLIRWAKAIGRRLAPLGRPIVLPLVALGVMLLVRACGALWPDAAAHTPITLVILSSSLVWWMSVAGAISLAEQRQTIPWMLAVIGVAGVLGWAGYVDNHVLPLGTIDPKSIDPLRRTGLAVTALLAIVSALIWPMLTYRPSVSTTDASTRPWRPRERVVRGTIVAVILIGLLVGLHIADTTASAARQTAQAVLGSSPGTPARPGDGKPAATTITQWAADLQRATNGDDTVYLVASEGGGIRAAYWTALVLAELHDRDASRGFSKRVIALSGVSGGALGEAVFVACLRESTGGASAGDCVRKRFEDLDPLSPLIGGLTFEDVYARFLPLHKPGTLSVCSLPACGFLSRALGFEREWVRQFARLGDGLREVKPGEPALLLNSTWVESGNRATLSSLRLQPGDMPASEDVVEGLGAQPSLVTAAHAAARFPYVNPLAALQPASAAGTGKIVGHLADGGYHDNSGAEALADVWRIVGTSLKEKGWKPKLILIRNGQNKPECVHEPPPHEPPPNCLAPPPVGAGEAAKPTPQEAEPSDLARALRKAEWRLYVDLLGPPVTVVNVSGIGARARQAAAALSADIGAPGRAEEATAAKGPCLLDQANGPTLVPLGWYLSPTARKALEALAAKVERCVQ